MKSKNDVSECIHCHVCQKHCEFLKKYGIDIGDTEKLKELSLLFVWKMYRSLPDWD